MRPPALAILITAILASCSASETPVKTDLDGLSEYITLPFVPKTLAYELVIVPEPAGLPGPTDWAGLVAIIQVDQNALSIIQKLPLSTESCSLSRYFVRQWFTARQKEAAYGLPTHIVENKLECYDATPLLVKDAIRSFVAPLDGSKYLLYIEYMNPNG